MEDGTGASRLASQARALGSIFGRPSSAEADGLASDVRPIRPSIEIEVAETLEIPLAPPDIPPPGIPGPDREEETSGGVGDVTLDPEPDTASPPSDESRPGSGQAAPSPADADAPQGWEPVRWSSLLPAFNIPSPRQIEE